MDIYWPLYTSERFVLTSPLFAGSQGFLTSSWAFFPICGTFLQANFCSETDLTLVLLSNKAISGVILEMRIQGLSHSTNSEENLLKHPKFFSLPSLHLEYCQGISYWGEKRTADGLGSAALSTAQVLYGLLNEGPRAFGFCIWGSSVCSAPHQYIAEEVTSQMQQIPTLPGKEDLSSQFLYQNEQASFLVESVPC